MIAHSHCVRAGLTAPAFAAMLAAAFAAPSALAQEGVASPAYAWEPAPAEIAVGDGVRVAVLLTGPDGPVALNPEAVTEARIDMGPDGMAGMAAPLRPVDAAEDESLAWETDLVMGGRWALKLTAEVPGAAESVDGEVVFTATPPDAAE